MPARTLNDFFVGFFMANARPVWRLRWQLQSRATGEKVIGGRAPAEREGDIKIIKIKGEGDKEQEVTVRHEGVPKKKGSSVWSGREEFTREWSGTFTTKKRKKIEKKGE